MKRKQYTKELKARIALDAIKGQKTVNELATEYEVHPTQINHWKKQALESLPMVFGNTHARRQAAQVMWTPFLRQWLKIDSLTENGVCDEAKTVHEGTQGKDCP